MCRKATILQFYRITFQALCFFYIIVLQFNPMARKIIGYYNDAQDRADPGQLILEISHAQIACLVKGTHSQLIEGFEVFALEKETGDWSDIFYEVRSGSEILNKPYRETHCYYNCKEALIIPEQKFSVTAAEDYLSLVYGESSLHDTKYDTLLSDAHIVNAYRIKRSMHELIGRHFVLYKPHHSYSRILDDILTRDQLEDQFVKIQFYSSHIILAFVKNKQLQLIQSFQYQVTEDILYYLLSIIQQFGISTTGSQLEINGIFERDSVLYQQFTKLFGHISFDTLPPDASFSAALAHYPDHYFAPFYKLAV